MVQSLGRFYFNEDIAHYNDKILERFLKSMHIQILGYGRSVTDSSLKRIENFSLPAFLMVYYEQGSVTLTHASQTTQLTPGSLYIFNPFELFTGIRTSDTPLVYKYIYFDIAPLSTRSIFVNYTFINHNENFQQSWYNTAGANLLENAYSAGQRNVHGWHFMLQCAVSGILAYTIYKNTAEIADTNLLDQNRSADIIDQAFTYTAQHLSEPINIGKLVRTIGTSRTTLDRVFNDILQISPMQAMTRYKIREALSLLQKGGSLKETSKLLGYSSGSHLSAVFKKVLGKSPREYMNT